jgi:thiol-disulfide isomerase/thioredoxin
MTAINLFFLYTPGCPACHASTPALIDFARTNPTVRVFKVDLSRVAWPRYTRWEPRATPTYVVHVPGRKVAVREGAIEKRGELQKWVEQRMLPAASSASDAIVDAEWQPTG